MLLFWIVFNLAREDQPSFSSVQKLPTMARFALGLCQLLGCLCFAFGYCEQDTSSNWEAFNHAREAAVWSK